MIRSLTRKQKGGIIVAGWLTLILYQAIQASVLLEVTLFIVSAGTILAASGGVVDRLDGRFKTEDTTDG